MVLLTRLGGLEETEQRALGHVAGELEQAIDPQIVHVEGVEALSEEQMPVADYFATVPLYLEYFTYRGDEVDGAEPLGPA